ncbi:MAG: methyltransferase domain-containing protein [Thermoplasmata archaeon]|uniref:Methyltransferase domain-containing protein n=1 Tax=Candidatus Sysuiplasma superficiale TaxID=2823368 RepID=A0A8J7YPG5_9ARCH|nr:methyltransferase domain-containing protein [Candidatus Sysuiplasma superficiale]
MSGSNNNEAARDFFSRNAERYAKSDSHAHGSDLPALISHIPLSERESALDVATGTGFTALELAKIVPHVCGVDTTYHMLGQARLLLRREGMDNVCLCLSDASHLPFADQTFDAITCRRAAHHFADKAAFLLESRRCLRSGGYIGISDMVAPEGFEGTYNDFERARDSSHFFAENSRKWESILSSCGFGVTFSEVKEERVTFSRWLYPVEESGPEGKKCREFLEHSDESFRRAIGYRNDEHTFIKRRMVIVASV